MNRIIKICTLFLSVSFILFGIYFAGNLSSVKEHIVDYNYEYDQRKLYTSLLTSLQRNKNLSYQITDTIINDSFKRVYIRVDFMKNNVNYHIVCFGDNNESSIGLVSIHYDNNKIGFDEMNNSLKIDIKNFEKEIINKIELPQKNK